MARMSEASFVLFMPHCVGKNPEIVKPVNLAIDNIPTVWFFGGMKLRNVAGQRQAPAQSQKPLENQTTWRPMNKTELNNATASALLPAAGLLCGCGRPVQYSHGDKHSCNKRVVCPTYDELREQCYRANALVMAYREKRKWDGLNGRVWSASKHFEAEARIEELESHNDAGQRLAP